MVDVWVAAYGCMYVRLHVRLYVCLYVRVCVRMYAYIRGIHTYTHTYVQMYKQTYIHKPIHHHPRINYGNHSKFRKSQLTYVCVCVCVIICGYLCKPYSSTCKSSHKQHTSTYTQNSDKADMRVAACECVFAGCGVADVKILKSRLRSHFLW